MAQTMHPSSRDNAPILNVDVVQGTITNQSGAAEKDDRKDKAVLIYVV